MIQSLAAWCGCFTFELGANRFIARTLGWDSQRRVLWWCCSYCRWMNYIPNGKPYIKVPATYLQARSGGWLVGTLLLSLTKDLLSKNPLSLWGNYGITGLQWPGWQVAACSLRAVLTPEASRWVSTTPDWKWWRLFIPCCSEAPSRLQSWYKGVDDISGLSILVSKAPGTGA